MRLDAMHGIKNPKSGKTYWNKIGIAVQNKTGGYSLYLDYMPLGRNEDGKVVIGLFPPRENGDRPSGGGNDRPRNRDKYEDRQLDANDEIPF